MTNNTNADTDIKEILKQVEQVVTDEMQSMTAILGGFFMMHLKGKSTGCAQQVNQAVAVETSHGVTTEAIKACNDLKGTVKLEGACDKKVSSSLTPDGSPQNIDEVEGKGRS